MNDKKIKKPWPTKKAMEQVYELNLWGDNNTNFYSGDGSHYPDLVKPYIVKITSFLTSFDKPLSLLDLGCGDFNVGKQLVHHSKKYTAIDIVQGIIDDNIKKYTAGNLSFLCLDIVTNKLPKADCILLRQVLQHLSNKEIIKILEKLNAYKYIILTEHIPEGNFDANINIISGQGIRLKKHSGVDLLKPPFNFKAKKATKLLSLKPKNWKGVIVTYLYEVF
ncbi:class I SAM-dependent methyltransferase [Polaribacter porphyrae]|uniref:SAM-dependent methyltransferase n=1 Tax=Polaribacter porphyrae TaxID=1137780 RepID=A0A2S7WJN8_9FLAO|nr:methyltransferase domain-containing protein [Polaribacter porphyrae]PQJ77793.1 SAM-dependent methyltransferase [Polaribacter porphyrae]